MWLRKINDSGEEFRYDLQNNYTAEIALADGTYTQGFLVIKYWKNNDGEFQRCVDNSSMYVPIETLLSQFILIGSNVDNELKTLGDFKKQYYDNNLEDSLKPFCFDKEYSSQNIGTIPQTV